MARAKTGYSTERGRLRGDRVAMLPRDRMSAFRLKDLQRHAYSGVMLVWEVLGPSYALTLK